MLVYWGATWCPPCNQLKAEVFDKPRFAELVRSIVAVKIDGDDEHAQALGAERINIEDFELQHISPERGGTLSILIEGEAEARRAATMLEAQGYGVSVSAVLDEG